MKTKQALCGLFAILFALAFTVLSLTGCGGGPGPDPDIDPTEGSASNQHQGNGGGVYVALGGTFRIVNGTVYGSDAAAGLKNAATNNGAALYVGLYGSPSPGQAAGIAQRGTLNGSTWTSAGSLSTTSGTISVANGALQ